LRDSTATPAAVRAVVQAETEGHAAGGQAEKREWAGAGAADVADLPFDGTQAAAVDLLRDHGQPGISYRAAGGSSVGPTRPVQRRFCGISR
jgi:hypothetical protein